MEEERNFLDAIDCNFPYQDREECVKLIDQAISISPNAAFAVVEELCRIPVSARKTVPQSLFVELLDIVGTKFKHPLKDVVFGVAKTMIGQKEIPVDTALLHMNELKNYPWLSSVLNIFYSSCYDTGNRLESAYNEIVAEWESRR